MFLYGGTEQFLIVFMELSVLRPKKHGHPGMLQNFGNIVSVPWNEKGFGALV